MQDIQNIISVLPNFTTNEYNHTLFKAMILTSFFGLLRIGEITLSPTGHSNIIRKEAISLSHQGDRVTSINIHMISYKHSKGHAASIPLSRQSSKPICPVRALLKYLKMSSRTHGHLFHYSSGQTVPTKDFRSL